MNQSRFVKIIDTNARKTVKIKKIDMIEDYITGKQIPNIGAEENRQKFESFLLFIILSNSSLLKRLSIFSSTKSNLRFLLLAT